MPFLYSPDLSRGMGLRVKLTDESKPFIEYFEMPQTRWIAYFDRWDNIRIDTNVFDNMQENDRKNILINVIGYNDANKAIALHAEISNGDIIFLPLSEHTNAANILVKCATKVRRKIKDREKPDWLSKYKVPNETDWLVSLNVIQKQIDDLTVKKQTMQSELDAKTVIKQLLYEGDEPLEDAVKIAFEELGFSTDKKDKIDLLIKSNEGEAIVEVIGSEKAIDIKKLRQLIEYLDRENKNKFVTKSGVLVANHYMAIEPDTRDEPFTDALVHASKELDICLLTTIELFSALCKAREGILDKATIRKKILTCVGICKV